MFFVMMLQKRTHTILKAVLKAAAFVLAFILLFLGFQSVLHHKWYTTEDLYSRNMDYKAEQEGTIDVLFFGTSEIWNGITPSVLYHEYGFTSYNFAVSWKTALTQYEQLRFALQYQKPEVVVCDFSSLFDGSATDEMLHKIYDTMPDRNIRMAMLDDICEMDSDTDRLNYLVPLYRYHAMWSSLTKADFTRDYVIDHNYNEFSKGGRIVQEVSSTANYMPQTADPSFWEPDGEEYQISDISEGFYDRFIDLCRENGAQVVCVNAPSHYNGAVDAAQYESKRQYLEDHGVTFLNYNTYEAYSSLGFNMDNLDEDFYDSSHLNWRGAEIWTKAVGRDLEKAADLPDRRGQLASWDANWEEYEEYVHSLTVLEDYQQQ